MSLDQTCRIETFRIRIEQHLLSPQIADASRDLLNRNDCFFIPWSSAKQSRHLNDGAVEDIEDELRRDADCEHEQCDGNNDELFAPQEIGERPATVGQRT